MPPARLRLVIARLCLVGSVLAASSAVAQVRASIVVQGLTAPVAFIQDPSDAATQYVVEQGGRIRVVKNGVLQATNFLDLSGSIVSGGEQGLLGLAFSRDYATSGRFYVNFTNTNGDTVVARFKRSAANPLVADPTSRFDMLWSTGERVIRQPFANHNGGNLVFGPDGFLYIGMGDGGSGDDPGNRAQDPTTLLGKMLRIDVNVPDSDTKGFRVPPDNPFLSGVPISAQPEIWDIGVRNPWRFSFDDPGRGGTGALVIGDVGQSAFEEVDYEPRGHGGRNYGWRYKEGLQLHITTLPPAFLPLTDPIFEYDHTVGVAIMGGFVYRGGALGPGLFGRYFYADLTGRIWSLGLNVDATTGEATVVDQREHTAELGGSAVVGTPVSFGVDAAGELYFVNQGAGTIVKIVPGSAVDSDGDGLPDSWEIQFGLNPLSAAGNDGANGDPDGDGLTNMQEFELGTHPRGFVTRYFAEGAVNNFFDTFFALFNPNPGPAANVLLRYQRTDGTQATRYVSVPPLTRVTVNVKDTATMAQADFSTIVESDRLVVADRTMKWDATGYGGHTKTAVTAPAMTWYLAEGTTFNRFQLFYLISNPNAQAANIQITYLRPAPAAPVVKTYTIGATSRLTVFVNGEDPALVHTSVSAIVASTNGLGIVVERSLYLNSNGQLFGAGHSSPGVTAPSMRWILAEGATGAFFNCYLLLANPGSSDAMVTVNYLLPGGQILTRPYAVPALSRVTVWVNGEDPMLANTPVSMEVVSTNGVPIVAERAMWWPGRNPGAWRDATDSVGSTGTGLKWAFAEGEQGGAAGVQTYLLITNAASVPGTALIEVFFEDGTGASQTVPVPPRSRTTMNIGATFASSAGRRFSMTVESLGATAQLVVERSMFWSANGVGFAAGTASLGVILQ